ncbi:MAG: hypothetical protein ACYSOT_04500, partial [Planctomycetota bacterium]
MTPELKILNPKHLSHLLITVKTPFILPDFYDFVNITVKICKNSDRFHGFNCCPRRRSSSPRSAGK